MEKRNLRPAAAATTLERTRGVRPRGPMPNYLKRRSQLPAKAVVEDAVRRDFVRQVARFAERLIKNPFGQGLTLPAIREQAFAKTPGKLLFDRSLAKYPTRVFGRDLEPRQKFSAHTHSTAFSDMPADYSLSDLSYFVKTVQSHGKVAEVINIVNVGPSYRSFFDLYNKMHVNAIWRQAERKLPNFSKAELAELKSAGERAAKEFAASGRVFMQPTKNLLKMMGPERARLIEFLERKVAEVREAKADKANSYISSSERIGRIYLETDKKIAQVWGELFKLRYVAMPGYRFDEKSMQFVKIK